jgi:hypothetical protein
MEIISAPLLYAPGAFFFYPWKPLVNAHIGDKYEIGYEHFHRDHSDPTNAALHIVALCLQLVGNFGLLNVVDDMIALHYPFARTILPFRFIGAFTACIWMRTLIISPAPALANILSCICITMAYFSSPFLAIYYNEIEIVAMAAFVMTQLFTGLVFSNKVDGKKKGFVELLKDILLSFVLFSLLIGVRLAAGVYGGGIWANKNTDTSAGTGMISTNVASLVNIAFPVLLALIAKLPDPVKPVTIMGSFGCRIIAQLTSQAWPMFYSCAFVGMVLQGRSHDVTKQQATLLNIEKAEKNDLSRKIRFEWAHVTYFPSLLFHSIIDFRPIGECVRVFAVKDLSATSSTQSVSQACDSDESKKK